MFACVLRFALFAATLALSSGAAQPAPSAGRAVIWRLERADSVGGQAPTVLGVPRVEVENGRPSFMTAL